MEYFFIWKSLTAYAGEMDDRQAIAVGFQQHISKPVDPEELVKVCINPLQPQYGSVKVK